MTVSEGEQLLRERLGPDARIETIPYGATQNLGGTTLSFHPAGHVLGSSQVRLEYQGEVWVVSSDYKLAPDPTCAPFEPVPCHTFVTESTFGLPIYRWTDPPAVFDEINRWWRHNQTVGKATVVFAYAIGKAQRILAGIDPGIGPVFAHGAVRKFNRCYQESGISLPAAGNPENVAKGYDWTRAIILAPPSARATPWLRRFGPISTAFASGWMRVRGARRRKSIDRGFVLSDHADWTGLLEAIRLTGAENVWVSHGYRSALVRFLVEQGLQATAVETRWEDDELDLPEPEADLDRNAPASPDQEPGA